MAWQPSSRKLAARFPQPEFEAPLEIADATGSRRSVGVGERLVGVPSTRQPTNVALAGRRRRRLLGAALCCVLTAGVLNTEDLAPVIGRGRGTLGDHLLNVWWWDAAILGLSVVSLPCLFLGVRALARAARAAAAP